MNLLKPLRKIKSLSLIKTLHFNKHYFGWRGLFKFPVLIAKGVQFKSLKGKIMLDKIGFNYLTIGFPSLGTENDHVTKGTLEINGLWVVHGKSSFAKGSSISIGNDSVFEHGNLVVTGDTSFICKKRIQIGNDCMISWGGYLMDTDCHKIFNKSKELINPDKPILIGNHVWVGMNVTVLKGSVIPDESVIAAGSVVTKHLYESNAVYVNNAVVKKNTSWEN